MKHIIARMKYSLLYAMVGGSLFWPLPATGYAAEQIAGDQTVEEQASSQAEGTASPEVFSLAGVEVTAGRLSEDRGYVAKRSRAGTKTDTPLAESARSISVVTQEQLQARGANSLVDALAYTAGVANLENKYYLRAHIRGFSVGAGLTYTDGLRGYTGGWSFPNTDLYSFDRIEVLRGPAGILYGAGSPGGLINQVSKRPTAEPFHEIELQTGSNRERSAALDVGGPATADGKLLFRLTARNYNKDLYHDYSSESRHFIAPALTWQPDDHTSLTILTHFQKENSDGDAHGPVRYFPGHNFYGYSDRLLAGEPGYDGFDRENTQIGYVLEHQINATWAVRQSYRHSDLGVNYRYMTYDAPVNGIISRLARYILSDLTGDALDTHLQAIWSGGAVAHTVLLGVDYQRSTLKYSEKYGGQASPLDLNNPNYGQTVDVAGLPYTYIADTTTRQTGFYAQDQMKFGQRWTAIVGGRYDRYDSDTLNRLSEARTVIDQNAFTGRLGVIYDAGRGLMPYFSYDESFEGQSGVDRYGNRFDPTTGRQVELGVQYRPKDANARFSAAVFDLRKQNVLTSDPLNQTLGGNYSVQTGEEQARGLELEANMQMAQGLNLTAAYTLLDKKVTKDNNPVRIGLREAGVPRHSASLWLDNTRPDKQAGGWSFGGGVRYIGSRYDSSNAYKQPDVLVADAMVRYDADKWRYQLNVQNLFDKQYVVSSYRSYYYDNLHPGRTVRLTASCRW